MLCGKLALSILDLAPTTSAAQASCRMSVSRSTVLVRALLFFLSLRGCGMVGGCSEVRGFGMTQIQVKTCCSLLAEFRVAARSRTLARCTFRCEGDSMGGVGGLGADVRGVEALRRGFDEGGSARVDEVGNLRGGHLGEADGSVPRLARVLGCLWPRGEEACVQTSVATQVAWAEGAHL